jgi:dihydroorotase
MNLDALFVKPARGSHERSLLIRRPDDCHVHLRDGEMMRAVLPFTASKFARGVIMPNLTPPVATVAAAAAYRERILAARPIGNDFEPLMTCYLTNETTTDEIERGYSEGVWIAAKLYPAGATTNSSHGVTDMARIRSVLEKMERMGMPLLVHGETTDVTVDIFDREAEFMERNLLPLLREHQGLRVVVEHVTTQEAVDVVRSHAPRVAGTITPHHLVINRTSIFQGGLRPHLYCLPVAKREHHRIALRKAATGGEDCFFAGTDTAPHLARTKEASCGCAGIFAGPTALQTYAQVFEEEEALDKLEAFTSLNGARFYQLPLNKGKIELIRVSASTPHSVHIEGDEVVIYRGGEQLPWSVRDAQP